MTSLHNVTHYITPHNCFAMQLFDVRSCVGQGDSLSAYLFIIALEVLLVIMSDEEIKGIAVENEVLRSLNANLLSS